MSDDDDVLPWKQAFEEAEALAYVEPYLHTTRGDFKRARANAGLPPKMVGAPVAARDLNNDERNLLVWLGESEYSQYGECYGSALSALIVRGLVEVHGRGEHQDGFIVRENLVNPHVTEESAIMYRAVSLTEKGRAVLKEMQT